jgi:2-C-methyl-D-erythritol 4-phosphate cytidylyltransferase / 2-C-methyl-D-erythritol 2,4-cyclodiphosphate synthase
MFVSAIIVAAGKGERLGADRPKQFIDLGNGKTMLDMSVEAMMGCEAVREIVVALPIGTVPSGIARPGTRALAYVEGGVRRQDSVANAFAKVSPVADVVVVHDAARPFVTSALIERTIQAANDHGAAIAAVRAIDTVKQALPFELTGTPIIRATLPRDTVFLAQTPQAFRREVLSDAMAAAEDASVTDEAMLVERAGIPVHIVEGDADNVKVTTAEDLARARAAVSQRAGRVPATIRIGTGYDLHRLVEGRPLVLAGVRIPHEKGLIGHSDADIVCHAVTDAVLGAAGLGDIGRLFPDTDPQWKDADSLQLLRRAVTVVHEGAFRVGNVDVTVIAERPKLLPYLDEMQARLATALGVDRTAVSIKGKTNEGVGETGRGKAMACHAVALLTRT